MRLAVGGLIVLSATLLGCHQSRHALERVEVVGATVADNPDLALDPGQLQALFASHLARDPHFRLLGPGEHALPTVRMSLELAFTREEQRQDRPGTYAEVGAALALRRKTEDGTSRYDVTGLGEAKLAGDGVKERREGLRSALESALDHAIASARLQLDALDKNSRELAKDLRSSDARVRGFALHELAERKDAAAVPGLIARLQDGDPDEVRKAMGGLVEIGDPRAVPPLIDLMRGKDPGFAREILFALGAIGGEEAEAYLYTVAQGHEQQPLRQAAEQALSEMKERRARASARASAGGAAPRAE